MTNERIIEMLKQHGYRQVSVGEYRERKNRTYIIVGKFLGIYMSQDVYFVIRPDDFGTGVDTYKVFVKIDGEVYEDTTVNAYKFFQTLTAAISGKLYERDIIRSVTGVFAKSHPYEYRFWYRAASYEKAGKLDRSMYITFAGSVEDCKNRMRELINQVMERREMAIHPELFDKTARYDILSTENWWMPKEIIASGKVCQLCQKSR